MGRRNKIEAIHDLLLLLKINRRPLYAQGKNPKGMRTTWILHGSGLCYTDFKRYLTTFLAKGLVVEYDDGTFGITAHGKEMLEKLNALISDLGLANLRRGGA